MVLGGRPWNFDSLINCVTLGIILNLIETLSPYMYMVGNVTGAIIPFSKCMVITR